MKMDLTTLQLWSVIGTWVAGIGTIGAVITSLWFALHQNTIKLKVSAGHRILVRPGFKETPDYCSIRVVNVGLRPARVTSIGWEVGRWRNKKYMIQSFGHPGFDDVPKTLHEGEEASFMIPFLSSGGDEDWAVRFPRYIVGEGSPSLIKTLKVTVHTSVGLNFKRRAERDLIDKLAKSYKTNNEPQPPQKPRG